MERSNYKIEIDIFNATPDAALDAYARVLKLGVGVDRVRLERAIYAWSYYYTNVKESFRGLDDEWVEGDIEEGGMTSPHTVGVCDSCGQTATLYAGICDRCRVKEAVGS